MMYVAIGYQLLHAVVLNLVGYVPESLSLNANSPATLAICRVSYTRKRAILVVVYGVTISPSAEV